jgi:Putative beta-barrel porin-2, OmpL-like. bbp2
MLTSITACLALALGQTGLPAAPLPNAPATPMAPATSQFISSAAVQAAKDGKDAAAGTTNNGQDAPKDAPKDAPMEIINGNGNGGESKTYGPIKTFFRAYPTLQTWFPKCLDKEEKPAGAPEPEPTPAPRRSMPAPFWSPTFPGGGEYQGTPLIGAPISGKDDYGPATQALHAIPGGIGKFTEDQRIMVYGWVNASTNWSTNKTSNLPDSYWMQANRLNLNQFVMKVERQEDTVQTDHCDWGFRSVILYGEDYRFTTSGGWGIEQLTKHNALYGWDPIEQYVDLYVPWILEGMIMRVGRWVACPDIETQLAPDNYLISHSILFTYDTYTQTGLEWTFRVNEQWMFQLGINCGDDMAPWYKGATPSGFLALRWVSKSNNDSIYTALNQINDAQFRHFQIDGQDAGHDNYNYIVSTWQHRFEENFFTKTEGYFMWQNNAFAGGTVDVGPNQPYALAGAGPLIPGATHTFGGVNYTCYGLSKTDYLTFRNEVWRDTKGMRSGFAGTYASSTVGETHEFGPNLQMRIECGYYRNFDNPAFDLGTKFGAWIAGLDFILKF